MAKTASYGEHACSAPKACTFSYYPCNNMAGTDRVFVLQGGYIQGQYSFDNPADDPADVQQQMEEFRQMQGL